MIGFFLGTALPIPPGAGFPSGPATVPTDACFFQGACSNLLTMSDHVPMPRYADLKHRLKLKLAV